VTIPEIRGPSAEPTPLTPQILKPIEKLADEMWPGVPVIPALSTGATDAQFLNPAGIPTYGIDGSFYDPDGGYAHGLNERIRVRSVYEGRTFLYRNWFNSCMVGHSEVIPKHPLVEVGPPWSRSVYRFLA
jgi:acetylornithine deacetylase/succinyl-diaminopimelate desuccinylase-like protein